MSFFGSFSKRYIPETLLLISICYLRCAQSQLTNALVPVVCDSYYENIVPSFIQDVITGSLGSLQCQPTCTRPDQNYHFQLSCDAAGLTDAERDARCKNGHSALATAAKLLACPTFDCVNNSDDEKIVLTATCNQPIVDVNELIPPSLL